MIAALRALLWPGSGPRALGMPPAAAELGWHWVLIRAAAAAQVVCTASLWLWAREPGLLGSAGWALAR